MAKKNKTKKGEKKSQKKDPKKGKKAAKALEPKLVKTGKGASPLEVGQAVVAGFNAHKPERELWDAHWSRKVESIEGLGVSMKWVGRKAMEAKGAQWMATHKIYAASAEGPFVGATGFAVRFSMDVEDTTTGKREMMHEVGVYTVKSGKVVCEEFMYKV